jgi:hypothetical protein
MANMQEQIISGKPHGTYRILHIADNHIGISFAQYPALVNPLFPALRSGHRLP